MSSAASTIRPHELDTVARRDPVGFLGRAVFMLARPLVFLVFRPRIVGREHLPPGGCVVSANHLSGFDAWALAYVLRPRTVRFMGKNALFRHPLARPAVRMVGVFPARSEEAVRGGVELATELARAGEPVAIFPEGARRRGVVRRPRHGAARIALASDVPLVPVGLAGMDGWRHLARWHVVVGAPIDLDDLRDEHGESPVREATTRLWSAILALEAEITPIGAAE
jgi:1-acyl-sn-glycerol-3-phosphate acyltransferase